MTINPLPVSFLPSLRHAWVGLVLGLALPGAAAAEDEQAQAEKAWHDAQATNNAYVIDAVRQQLLKEHPEYKNWVNPGGDIAQAGRVNAAMPPDTTKAPLPGSVTPAATVSTSPAGATVANVAAPPKPVAASDVKYTGEVQGGFESDTGNSRGSSINSKANITRDSEDWRFLAQESVAVDESLGVTSKETYRALAQANYKLSDDERLMTTVFWTSDRFTGFRDRFDEVSGLSNDWKLPYKIKLTTELAAGAQQIQLVDRTSSSEPIIWLRGAVDWPIAERWDLTEDLRNVIAQRYSFISSNTALTTQLREHWKLRLSAEADYSAKPPLDRQPLDTTTLVNLVYGF